MTKIQTVTNAIVNQGILPLYYNDDETVTIDILKSLYKAGIRAVEYTSRGESALSN
ncbi:MAG: bifunctional 4-hydroxy-2-oxoglutarate aldolase/2-dehydro-3-deoxy-phosphogluconate aldolase, partial [Chryseobacterium gambrini]|nr:bifunctional 4-hydroxy-2-oxoglutarate aldolase/2-dehydro-3-deoxy-phosphogluconate aldolase [Chryseobacterium gambrini]